MKTTVKMIAALPVCIMMIACANFLEENPRTTFSQESVFSTDKGAWGAVTGAMYQVLQGGTNSFYFVTQLASGCSASSQNQVGQKELLSMTFPATNSNTNGAWLNSYISLNNLNICIENEDNSALSDSVRMKAKGTAHFFRAYLLTNLVSHWGDVPMPLKPGEMRLPRAKTFDIYTQILADLKIAEENLSPYKGEGNVLLQGMPCLYTVYGFRAKVYAFMACIAQYPDDPFHADGFDAPAVYWQQAYDNAKYVYDYGGYDLANTRSSVDQVFSYYNKYNPYESLCEITCSTAGGASFNNSYYFPQFPASGGHPYCYSQQDTLAGGVVPNPLFMCSWDYYTMTSMQMGGSIVGSKENWCSQYKKYHNNAPGTFTFPIPPPQDPRLIYYYITYNWYDAQGAVTSMFPNQGPMVANNTQGWPFYRKYFDPKTTLNTGSSNIIVLRYADVLLLLAEAANELGKNESEVIGYVNEVLTRARTNIPATCPYTGQPASWQPGDYPAKEEMRRAIMDERLYELGGEFHDFADYRRHGSGLFLERLKQRNDIIRGTPPGDHFGAILWNATTGVPLNVRAVLAPGDVNNPDYPFPENNPDAVKRAMLLPIPQNELNANPNIDSNNYGY